MNPIQQRIVDHLAALVACDTQNPPREIGADHAIFAHLEQVLRACGFSSELTDHGDGRIGFLAQRRQPGILFNVHLDTVPVGSGWSKPPLELTIENERAFGRGSCDIKGAAAVLLALAEQRQYDMALLFTTDEEGASGCCVQHFASELAPNQYRMVVVAEPTGCQAVLAHRGYLSVLGQFSGEPGHSSEPRALTDSALHQACQWAAAAVDYAAAHPQGICFNLGTLRGGSASNVIAATADVHWSARLAPGGDNDAELRAIGQLTPAAAAVDWNARFAGSPLPAAGQAATVAEQFANQHQLAIGAAVDFWTEASLFSSVGQAALVLGPGHIEQAHTIDEWVALDQLWQVEQIYRGLLERA